MDKANLNHYVYNGPILQFGHYIPDGKPYVADTWAKSKTDAEEKLVNRYRGIHGIKNTKISLEKGYLKLVSTN